MYFKESVNHQKLHVVFFYIDAFFWEWVQTFNEVLKEPMPPLPPKSANEETSKVTPLSADTYFVCFSEICFSFFNHILISHVN